MKGDNMEKLKKFKKALVVLTGFMVLMVGSVGALAADSSLSSFDFSASAQAAIKSFKENGCAYEGGSPSISSSDAKNYKYSVFTWDGSSSSAVLVVYRDSVSALKSGSLSTEYFTDTKYPVAYFNLYSSGKFSLKSIRDSSLQFTYYDSGSCISNSALDLAGVHKVPADNSGFFPVPVVAEKAEALPAVVRHQAGTILPIAVSCLALLTFSTVLLKRLPRFLG